MTQSTLNRLQSDIEKIYNQLKNKNLFKKIFSVLIGCDLVKSGQFYTNIANLCEILDKNKLLSFING